MKRITTLILAALMAIPGFAQKDIQNKLDLTCQRGCRENSLIHLSEHDDVSHADG